MTHANRPGEKGSVTIASVAMVGAFIGWMMLIAQLAIWQFSRAALQAAADEAVHYAAVVGGSAAECEDQLIAHTGRLASGAATPTIGRLACGDDRGVMRAELEVVLSSWLPGLPQWSVSISAAAIWEEPLIGPLGARPSPEIGP